MEETATETESEVEQSSTQDINGDQLAAKGQKTSNFYDDNLGNEIKYEQDLEETAIEKLVNRY